MGFVEVESRGDFAIVRFCREPVNTMNLAFWEELMSTLEELERDPKTRGVLFMSGVRRDVFTAGNDITELYAPMTSAERYRQFWLTSNRFLARLYTSPLVTVAAIRGACPAGGCCLALCCDHRVMTSDVGNIGLNEVALGISVPKFWGRLMARVIGQGPAEKLLQFAVMLSPRDAQEVGLVDELAPKSSLQETAEKAMRGMLKSPDASRAETKRLLRAEFASEWEAYLEEEAAYAWRQLSSPTCVAQLGGVLERLSGKKPQQSKL